jgi:hypothetical protein
LGDPLDHVGARLGSHGIRFVDLVLEGDALEIDAVEWAVVWTRLALEVAAHEADVGGEKSSEMPFYRSNSASCCPAWPIVLIECFFLQFEPERPVAVLAQPAQRTAGLVPVPIPFRIESVTG